MNHIVKGGVHLFDDEENGIAIRIDRIGSSKLYTSGNVQVKVSEGTVYYGAIRLNHNQDKNNLTRTCSDRHQEVSPTTWDSIIEEACTSADLHSRVGAKPVSLAEIRPETSDNFLLYPMILAGSQGSMMVAKGGSLKTYLAAYFAVLAARKGTNVVITDWEADEDEWSKRLHRICNAMNMTVPQNIIYQRQSSTLLETGDKLAELLAEHEAGLLIVDSLRGALQGALQGAEEAAGFFNTLRSFNLPCLVIHHLNKEGYTYGNVSVTNFIRLEWTITTDQHEDRISYTTTARSGKTNNSASNVSRTWDVRFEIANDRKYTAGDAVYIRNTTPEPGTPASQAQSLQEQIIQVLASEAMYDDDIVAKLELTDHDKFDRAIADMSRRGKIQATAEGRWRLS